jgi:hypothetical protein
MYTEIQLYGFLNHFGQVLALSALYSGRPPPAYIQSFELNVYLNMPIPIELPLKPEPFTRLSILT